jgi:hypothetical protein
MIPENESLRIFVFTQSHRGTEFSVPSLLDGPLLVTVDADGRSSIAMLRPISI